MPCGRRPVGCEPGRASVFDVGGVVGHLCHYPARGGDRGQQVQAVHRHRVIAVGGLDGGPVGQQLAGGGGRGADVCGPGWGLHPPGLGGAQDRDGRGSSGCRVVGVGVGHAEHAAQAGQVEFVVAAQRADHRAKFAQGFAAGCDAQEVLGVGGPHWESPDAVKGAQPGSSVLSNMSPSLKCSTRKPSGSRQ